MKGHTQLAVTPRNRFLEAAQNEMIAFEGREREFRRKEKQEWAAELQIPALEKNFPARWRVTGKRLGADTARIGFIHARLIPGLTDHAPAVHSGGWRVL